MIAIFYLTQSVFNVRFISVVSCVNDSVNSILVLLTTNDFHMIPLVFTENLCGYGVFGEPEFFYYL